MPDFVRCRACDGVCCESEITRRQSIRRSQVAECANGIGKYGRDHITGDDTRIWPCTGTVANHTAACDSQNPAAVRSGNALTDLNEVIFRDSGRSRADVANDEIDFEILVCRAGNRSHQLCEVVLIDFRHNRVGDGIEVPIGEAIGRHVECAYHIAENVRRVGLSGFFKIDDKCQSIRRMASVLGSDSGT